MHDGARAYNRELASAASSDIHRVITPYKPPMRFDPRHLSSINRIYRCRSAKQITLEGASFGLALSPIVRPQAHVIVEPFELIWRAGHFPLVMTLPCALLEAVLGRMQPDVVPLPTDPTLSLLLELALAPFLTPLEERLGLSLTLKEAHLAEHVTLVGEQSDREDEIVLCGKLESLDFMLTLRPASEHPAVSIQFLDHLAKLLENGSRTRTEIPDHLLSIPVPVAFCAGSTRLSIRELRSLNPGDILLPDDFPLRRSEIMVEIDARRRAFAKIEEREVRLHGALQRIQRIEGPAMSESETVIHPESVADLGDLEITLAFELGRQTMELKDIRAIAPGYVFSLDRSFKDPVDLVAHGRRIGRGEIVQIGDTVGVRIVRLFDHD